MYKCDKIWGEKASKKLLEELHNIYKKEYTPNDDVKHWVKEHEKAMKKQSLKDILKDLKLYKYNINKEDMKL